MLHASRSILLAPDFWLLELLWLERADQRTTNKALSITAKISVPILSL